MNDLFDLLNINQGIIRDFPLQASRIVDHQVEKVINRNVSKLKQIASSFNEQETLAVVPQTIAQIIRKVRDSAKKEDVFYKSWTPRELRIVSYYLMKLRDDSNAFYHALSLLKFHWRNLYFRGLVSYLVNSWCSIEPEYREAIGQLVMQKLILYEGNNRRYLLWKDKANFFDPNGPKRMVAMLCAKNMKVTEAPILLGFKDKTFKQSYYSDVMVRYVEKNAITDLAMVEELFTQHDLSRTKKLVLAYLVEQADRSGDEIRRSQLCRFINAQLGDVTLSATWAPFPGATEEDAQRLKEAMRLVNVWYTQKIIETFFELCVQDNDRKEFWLDYVPYIRDCRLMFSL
ncbi:MAG: EH signature domain-containing protein [Parabacteroides sp.]